MLYFLDYKHIGHDFCEDENIGFREDFISLYKCPHKVSNECYSYFDSEDNKEVSCSYNDGNNGFFQTEIINHQVHNNRMTEWERENKPVQIDIAKLKRPELIKDKGLCRVNYMAEKLKEIGSKKCLEILSTYEDMTVEKAYDYLTKELYKIEQENESIYYNSVTYEEFLHMGTYGMSMLYKYAQNKYEEYQQKHFNKGEKK